MFFMNAIKASIRLYENDLHLLFYSDYKIIFEQIFDKEKQRF